jgi:hypothetical protein
MYNCVKLVCDGKLFMIVHTIATAEYMRDLLKQNPVLAHCTWNIDWAYIEDVGF